MEIDNRATYWNTIGITWLTSRPQRLWRRYSDQINTALLEQWLPSGKIESVLKTDSFDEAFGNGLYPVLARRARSVTLMDISTVILSAARSNHCRPNATGADTCCLPFADEVFDVIVSNLEFRDVPR